MPHSFRFDPPEPRPGSITRPRLLRALLARWEHRVTSVIGGAGLGKTTLLAQSIAENRLAPRGDDVWLGVQPSDADADSLARDVLTALEAGGGSAAEAPSPRAVADAVWRRAPRPVCLVLDNVHHLLFGSPGADWLSELVDALPQNGRLLLSSRTDLPIPVTRLALEGGWARIGEDDLRFTETELAGFAGRHDVAVSHLDSTGGWPAMAELAASVSSDLAGRYLWEEVLRPLGDERRHVLAVVCDLGGADDTLASAALGRTVVLADELDGVPLVAVGANGWRAPHALWRSAPQLALGSERDVVRRRAVEHLVGLRRYDEAVTLAAEGGLPEMLPAVLRAACVSGVRPTVGELDRWLSLSPPRVRASAPGRLAEALRATLATPDDAAEPLRQAAALARGVDDLDAELVAIANLGRVGWWRQDLEMVRELVPRVAELAGSGHPGWKSLAAAGRAVFADLAGDDAGVVAELNGVVPGTLDAGWEAVADWMSANVIAGTGDAESALTALEAIPPAADPNFAITLAGLGLQVRWLMGEVDEVAREAPAFVNHVRASGLLHNLGVVLPTVSRMLSHVGDLDAARALHDEALGLHASQARQRERDGDRRRPPVHPPGLALASASLDVADGDEKRAAATLRATAEHYPIGQGPDRRTWRSALALGYVLLPETRSAWDATPLRGAYDHARRLAGAVVAVREGGDAVALRSLSVPPPGVVRAALHHRFAADLAVGLEAAGHRGSSALLEAIGPVGRAAVRELASSGVNRRTRPAKALLAAVPAPPPTLTEVAVLGPLALRRDGRDVDDPALRRERLRALLAFLVTQRDTTRGSIMAALWPDLDERSAANNLRVTLTYLLRLLEPWRAAGESAFHVRTSGQRVELVTGRWLQVDVDEFDRHVSAAGRAEADGSPSLALEHNRAAADLYRGDLHSGVNDGEWYGLERDRYRTRFVAAATRAGQLLAAAGENDAAEDMARRAIAVDAWAEGAYAVLVTTALAREDRSGARQALDRCMEALADLGVGPSDETQRLRRRLRAAS